MALQSATRSHLLQRFRAAQAMSPPLYSFRDIPFLCGGARNSRQREFAESQLQHLVHEPMVRHCRKVLALMRSAAFLTRKRAPHDRFRDEQHVTQIEPV